MKRILATTLAVLLVCSVLTGCTASPTPKRTEELANPMVEYETMAEIEEIMEFGMVVLPDDMGYTLESMYIIDGGMIQLNYTDAEKEAEVLLRKAEGDEDISGVNGIDYEQETINGIPAYIGQFEKTLVLWFEKEGFSYAISATQLDPTRFDSLVLWMTSEVNKQLKEAEEIAHEQRDTEEDEAE